MVRFVKIFSPEQDHFIVESAILVVQQDVHEVGTIKLEVETIITIQIAGLSAYPLYSRSTADCMS